MQSCKEEVPAEPGLPAGVSPYTATELLFVPYSGGNLVFKEAPAFTSEFTLNFKERVTPEEFYAWDQTFFSFSTDENLEIELRFRYLQAEESSQKTLAIYMPFNSPSGTVKTSVFETPIVPDGIEEGFFADLIDFHESIDFSGVVWNNVFEISPLSSTESELDSPENFSKVYYNQSNGIVAMTQKNGSTWVLTP